MACYPPFFVARICLSWLCRPCGAYSAHPRTCLRPTQHATPSKRHRTVPTSSYLPHPHPRRRTVWTCRMPGEGGWKWEVVPGGGRRRGAPRESIGTAKEGCAEPGRKGRQRLGVEPSLCLSLPPTPSLCVCLASPATTLHLIPLAVMPKQMHTPAHTPPRLLLPTWHKRALCARATVVISGTPYRDLRVIACAGAG